MMNRRLLLTLLGGMSLAAGGAWAQTPAASPVRLRGTIDAVSEDGLDLTVRGGAKTHVVLPAQFRLVWVEKADIADIKPGSYIGSAAAPMADGKLRALEVVVFPPTMKGVGLGHYPWDLGPSTTMTNGTVGSLEGTDGHTMKVDYGSGVKEIVIPADVPIVTFSPADRAALKAGAHVIVNGQKAADGTITVASVSVGRDGLVPPM